MPRKQPTKSLKLKEAQRLKQLRKSLGITQAALAKEFKVFQSAVAQWERGDRTIPGPVLRLIEIYESGVVTPVSKS